MTFPEFPWRQGLEEYLRALFPEMSEKARCADFPLFSAPLGNYPSAVYHAYAALFWNLDETLRSGSGSWSAKPVRVLKVTSENLDDPIGSGVDCRTEWGPGYTSARVCGWHYLCLD